MARRILIVTAVQAEADAIGRPKGSFVVTGGIGKTNSACATTSAILSDGPFTWVINAGVAGAFPNSGLSVGDIVIANECVYAEEGLITPDGFQDIEQMGFSLGPFNGNRIQTDRWMCERLAHLGTVAPIATVATCSGTNEHAELVATRTGCACEAMEGASVVHTALRIGTPAIEIRAISNTTGNREEQEWDIKTALHNLGTTVNNAITCLWGD